MITISIDIRMINASGIGRYIKVIVSHLLKENDFKLILLGNNNELSQFQNMQNIRCIEVKSRIFSFFEQIELPLKIPKCDIFWSPQYNIPVLPIKAKRRIVTIPDIYQLTHLHELSLNKKLYVKIVTYSAIKLSRYIVSISEFSKNEILKYTSAKNEKLKVIYCAVDKDFRGNIQRKLDRQNYILFVGNVKPHKNLKNALKAFKKIALKYDDYKFFIIGKKEGFITGYNNLEAMLEGLENKVVFTGYVSDQELKEYYANASIFFFPSSYEGFGLPILEAMKFNIPIVSSDAASLTEVGGDAVLYCNPNDVDDMAQKLDDVISQKTIFSADRYLVQLNKFSWQKAGEKYIELFRAIGN